jgi:transcriptional regulator with XRE-family HTH domain
VSGLIRIDDATRLGPALGNIRAMLGMRMSDLAEDAGLHTSQLSYWERGLRTPDMKSLVKLAHALGYDLALIPREDT